MWLAQGTTKGTCCCQRASRAGTCKDVDAAPISRPSDWATSEVMVPSAANRTNRTASEGCDVIQYTMLQ